jgi:TolA-binding protein
VLSVREWRGELWPESLYWCGICKMELGEFEPAFAYFQRVYVLYEGYPEWTARAYLKSAECLLKLNKAAEAMNTYREMLGKESLAKLPEFATAKAEFEKLGGRL